MARNFMYVYERIFKERNAMDREFGKIPVNGRQTSQAEGTGYISHFATCTKRRR